MGISVFRSVPLEYQLLQNEWNGVNLLVLIAPLLFSLYKKGKRILILLIMRLWINFRPGELARDWMHTARLWMGNSLTSHCRRLWMQVDGSKDHSWARLGVVNWLNYGCSSWIFPVILLVNFEGAIKWHLKAIYILQAVKLALSSHALNCFVCVYRSNGISIVHLLQSLFLV